MMLALKLSLPLVLIGLSSLAGKRRGPSVSGWLASLPVIGGPVVFFLSLEQGRAFAARAARGSILGLISLVGFALVYSYSAPRASWVAATVAGWLAFLLITFLLDQIRFTLSLSVAASLSSLALGAYLLPSGATSRGSRPTMRGEILVRMLAAAILLLVLTTIAPLLGPMLSGLLTPFPVVTTILAVFIHRGEGAAAVARFLWGMLIGLFTFAVFFIVVSLTLAHSGTGIAFTLACLAAAVSHACLFWIVRNSKYFPAGQVEES